MILPRLGFLFSLALLASCTTTRMSNTARTGMEQLLLSNAVDQTIGKLPLPAVEGQKVFVEEKYLDCVDKGYIVGSIRQRVLQGGGLLVGKPEDSQVTIEIRSGGVGTDTVDSFLGMPGMAVPGPFPIQVPEIRLYERASQYGTAKLALVAFDTATGRLLFDSGRQLARGDDTRWSVFGLGPIQSGSVRSEIQANTGIQPVRLASGTESGTR